MSKCHGKSQRIAQITRISTQLGGVTENLQTSQTGEDEHDDEMMDDNEDDMASISHISKSGGIAHSRGDVSLSAKRGRNKTPRLPLLLGIQQGPDDDDEETCHGCL